jgi:hypothetical protein
MVHYKVCHRALEITQLLFADDNLLFFLANRDLATSVKLALDKYCRGTGQLIRFDKCSILFNENQESTGMLYFGVIMPQHSGRPCGCTGNCRMRNSFTPPSLLQRLDALGIDASAQFLIRLWQTWHVRNTITHGNDKLSFEGSIKFPQKCWTEL